MREGTGPDVDLLLDLNFNAKTEGYLKILKAIADFDMFWVEIDTYSPEALGYIRRQIGRRGRRILNHRMFVKKGFIT
jgi:galactonate dehydratase